MSGEHGLSHVEMQTLQGPRLTPACVCGWYSPRCSHADFERHIKKETDAYFLAAGDDDE